MADNVPITPGSGKTIATDEVVDSTLGTVQVQYVKLMDATIDGTNKLIVSAAGAAKVDGSAVTQPVSGAFFQVTQPISAATLPLPTGASTSVLQTTGNSSLSSIDGKTPALGQALAAASVPVVLTAAQITILTPLSSISVSNFPATQPISGTVTANAGSGTFSVSGPLTDTQLRATPVPISGTVTSTPSGTQTVTGTVAATQSGTWTVQPGNTANTTAWKVDGSSVTQPVSGTFFQATQPVNGTVTANAGSGTMAVSGPVTDAQLRATPVPISGSVTITDGSGPITVDGTVAATQSGTWTVQPGNTENTTPWLVEDAEGMTYGAAIVGLVPVAAGATDVFTITGSATKVVRLLSVHLNGNATTATTVNCSFIKRSTANTAGTSTAPTRVPHDSTNPAATATILAYTANPTLGTLVGVIDVFKLDLPTAASATASQLDEDFNDDQPIVLRGTGEVLAINFNTTAIAGGNVSIAVHWVEE